MTHHHTQPECEPMNISEPIRCALVRHDAGHAWNVDPEDVAKLLAAYDRLTVAAPAQPAGMREKIAQIIEDNIYRKHNGNWDGDSKDLLVAADAILALPAERPADAQGSRPRDFLAWAVKIFGPVAKLRSERLLRFCEEAIELAHAEGMEREVLNRVADRVYSRPAGNVGKEIGQAQACLETFAENIGLSSHAEAQREWERVQEIPQDEWTRRHSAKQALGIALPSTVPLPPDWKQDQAETSRLAPKRPLCSCKASERDGQHMAWCPSHPL